MGPGRRARFGWLAAAVLLLAPATAHGAVGDLTPQGCIEDNGPPATGCAAENHGLNGAHAIAVSPDGKSLYATGLYEDTISIFSRNPATGALTPASCISDADPDVFEDSGCADFAEGLNEPFGIAVAPSGLDVYVAARGDRAVAHLTRDPVTGDLGEGGCVAYTGDAAGCGGTTQPGLDSPRDLVVDPDGASVYVADGFASGAVTRLARNPATGDISASGTCIGDPAGNPGCALEQTGLVEAYSIAISRDGDSIYVASRGSNAIVGLSVPGFGSLGCHVDSDTPTPGCTPVQGLGTARGVAVSPDGKSVYSNAANGAVVQFDRLAGGALSAAGCVQDTEQSLGCAKTTQGLGGGAEIAVSPDNASVYAVGEDNSLVNLARNPATGSLTPGQCFADAGTNNGCVEVSGLLSSRGVVVSPDGRSVYATSTNDAAVARFDRDTGAVEPPPPSDEVRIATKSAKCKGTPCKKFKVKAKVEAPGKVTFCSAPPGVNAPCGIAGKGPTGPERAAAKKATKYVKTKTVRAQEAGTVTASLTLTKQGRKRIAKKGKLSLELQVDLTPAGGERTSERATLKLKGKRRK
jgi:DNA-binding beta-propeller fold protein YncE